MSFLSTLRKSTSHFFHHFSIQRLQILHTSSSSPSLLNARNGLFAAIIAGTSLGFVLYTTDFDSTHFQSSISSFVDQSTPNSPSFLTKFSLPETSGTFLFRGKFLFLSRNFYNVNSIDEKCNIILYYIYFLICFFGS